MQHVGNRDSDRSRNLLSIIIIQPLYYMTAILYKMFYMAVVIIGLSFIIVAGIIYIIMKTYVTLTAPILCILSRAPMALESEDARRKGIDITPCGYRDITILGMAPWGGDDDWDDDRDDDDDIWADY